MVLEVSHENPVNLRIEDGGSRAPRQRRQLFLATRRADIGPVVQNVRIDRRPWGRARCSATRPGNGQDLNFSDAERHLHPHRMQDERLLADARSLAMARTGARDMTLESLPIPVP